MRTTVTLDADIAAEVERLRSEGIGPSEAINTLARRGLVARQLTPARRAPYRVPTFGVAFTMDISDIGEVLRDLDELEAAERATSTD